MDPGQRGPGWPVEDGPSPYSQDQQFEGEGDEETVTVNLALQLGVPAPTHCVIELATNIREV